MPLNAPISIPDAALRFAGASDAGAGSIGALRMIKLPAIEIAQREMRDVKILYVPRGGFYGIAADRLPEKRQFESKLAATGGFHVAGVIPPLGLKIRMAEIIAREFEAVTGQGGAVL